MRYHLAGSAVAALVARLSVDGADFWIQTDPEAKPVADASAMRLILSVDDPARVFRHAMLAGPEVNTIAQDHGWRARRIVDPFGDQWDVGKRVRE
jgi:uncharacterized glyoxalase superfamily protein PhnB